MLTDLLEMSNRYGANPAYVLAGGGNTSVKDGDSLYVKSSGASLAAITREGFVRLHRPRLREIFEKSYSADGDRREAEVLRDMMDARCLGEEAKRPSVEALLHEAMPFTYVLHIHPALENGMTCGKNGRKSFEELFGQEGVWVDAILPGYTLAVRVRQQLEAFHEKFGRTPVYVAIENHGIFYGGETVGKVDAAVAAMNDKLLSLVPDAADLGAVEYDREFAALLAPAVRCLATESGCGVAVFSACRAVLDAVQSEERFSQVYTSFTPDHIVYCNDKTLFIEKDDLNAAYEELERAVDTYVRKNGRKPKIIGVRGLGVYACGATKKEADTARDVFLDAVKVSVYARSFGGGKPMPEELVDAINNWEVERYRKSVSLADGGNRRLEGKIAVVTGSAQGFGSGIAREMAAAGAYITVADLNREGAAAVAEELNRSCGAGSAVACGADVGSEDSVRDMIYSTALEYGGLDVYVSNAGILRAGGLEEMELRTFELMTKVNYTAFFLGAKYASRIMKIQHRFNKDLYMDIIQINSKSGLSGSNRNFAYAGGKFGGIGLTQSFALELAEYGIKVNAVCPGNFFDGPLWSDPENGLLVQYLRTGKVPGAKTIEDVKRAYESKVPLGRGCTVPDVARAIFFVVEQVYETGQAIPVTGGQEMLN